MNRRDGFPQRVVLTGLTTTGQCDICGMEMRLSNIRRHMRYAHDPAYVQPSRTTEYIRTHRRGYYEMQRKMEQRAQMEQQPGLIYIVHLSRPIADRALHYCGYSIDVRARLILHKNGMGSALLAEARNQGITFALTYLQPGTRMDERAIKRNRRLKEMCSLCRDEALAKRAERMREWRARKREAR